MTVRQFRWFFISVLVLLMFASVAFSVEGQSLGASAEWTNDGYRFGGGSAPWAIAFSCIIAVGYVLLMRSHPMEPGQPLTGVFRRFAAFWLDFILEMTASAPIIGLLPILVEWKRTGVFGWTFVRVTAVGSDTPLLWLSFVLGFAGLLFYYAIPLSRGLPSPGSCIVGYQVRSDDGGRLTFRRALLRTLLGFFAVCCGYIAPFLGRDRKQGKFWLDKVFATRASLLG